jgi:L-ribulose-5-phosphate 4-epimerase
MLLQQLREEVLKANLELVSRGLVLYTFGNASGIDRKTGFVVIKPSGVDYGKLCAEDMVVVDLQGNTVEGSLKPSSDLDTHILLYREFGDIGAVVHTHSEFATSFAQAGIPIPAFGTTHADYFHGPIPVTLPLTDDAINGRYVHETGHAIVARFHGKRVGTAKDDDPIDPVAIPACLVNGHAPFVWGRSPEEAAHNAVVLEAVARMAYRTLMLDSNAEPVSQSLLDRHYLRKQGAAATYGQQTKERN